MPVIAVAAPHVGRPQDAELTARILAVTTVLLQKDGYASLRIEQIAAEAGCSKSALYRRWSTRAELAAAALQVHLKMGEASDSGNVVDDLVSHAWQNALNQKNAAVSSVGRHNLWALLVQPEVRDILWDTFFRARRERSRTIIARGIERKELPADVDADVILDLLAGFTFYRTTARGVPSNENDYRRIITALVASPPVRANS